jgi:predicted nucleic acid-binding protein
VIVLDASAIVNALIDAGPDGRAARSVLHDAGEGAVPDLADVETTAALRRRWLAGSIEDERFSAALDDLLALPLRRYTTGPLMRRAYQLGANVTPYDAAYVALAEELGCLLVTTDGRLARAPGLRCPVQVLTATA